MASDSDPLVTSMKHGIESTASAADPAISMGLRPTLSPMMPPTGSSSA